MFLLLVDLLFMYHFRLRSLLIFNEQEKEQGRIYSSMQNKHTFEIHQTITCEKTHEIIIHCTVVEN